MAGKGTEYTITYFDARGRAEIPRLLLKLKGHALVDNRLAFDDWKDKKGKTPQGMLPVLTVKEGETSTEICQSGAIVRYLARKLGYYGKSDADVTTIDEVFGIFEDVFLCIVKQFFDKNPEVKKEQFTKMVDSLVWFEKFVGEKRAAGKKFLLGDTGVSLADVAIFHIIDQEKRMTPKDQDTSFRSKLTNLNAIHENVLAIPEVAKWTKDRPETPL